MQRAAILFAAIVPLVPRPTIAGAASVISPAIALGVGMAAFAFVMARRERAWIVTPPLGIAWIVLAATTFYVARVLVGGEGSEIQFAISRILMILYAFAICFISARGGARRVIHYFAVATMILSILVIFVGVTGTSILEKPYPARTLGVTFPWFKTTGVPRSFGEQGIVLSLCLGYYLVYKHDMKKYLRLGLGVTCLAIFLMGQSRNMYLATLVVILTWHFVVKGRRWRVLRVVLLLSALATFVIEVIIPFLGSTALGAALIGEGIYERNVEARFSLMDGAMQLVQDSPLQALIGWQHADWQAAAVNTEAGVHNHFMASLLYLGVIGGAASIWALFVAPLKIVVVQLETHDLSSADRKFRLWIATVSAGVLVSLNFYEGFFSLALGMFIGLSWFAAAELRERRFRGRGS